MDNWRSNCSIHIVSRLPLVRRKITNWLTPEVNDNTWRANTDVSGGPIIARWWLIIIIIFTPQKVVQILNPLDRNEEWKENHGNRNNHSIQKCPTQLIVLSSISLRDYLGETLSKAESWCKQYNTHWRWTYSKSSLENFSIDTILMERIVISSLACNWINFDSSKNDDVH